MKASCEATKSALSGATLLGHPDPRAVLALHVDASASHVGAALHQRTKGCPFWQPLGFFSRKLDLAQKWSAFDCELFACVTDHKPLVGALAWTSDSTSV
jgi:hypothetical protein